MTSGEVTEAEGRKTMTPGETNGVGEGSPKISCEVTEAEGGKTMTVGEINGALLAYLGDAVIERLVRRRLILEGGSLSDVNKAADSMVRAGSQSKAADKILSLLTEEEECAYRRGKNHRSSTVPKNATQNEYKKATGLEALFGYLDLIGDTERIEFLLTEAFFK